MPVSLTIYQLPTVEIVLNALVSIGVSVVKPLCLTLTQVVLMVLLLCQCLWKMASCLHSCIHLRRDGTFLRRSEGNK